jgi:hypothetical protein
MYGGNSVQPGSSDRVGQERHGDRDDRQHDDERRLVMKIMIDVHGLMTPVQDSAAGLGSSSRDQWPSLRRNNSITRKKIP